ncbi:MAG: response regulator transcription factor [Acidobacteria bacterium]|nr:response regulator transcription factor [Acidobacteriota bacterium]
MKAMESPTQDPISVLLIQNQECVRFGLRLLIESKPQVEVVGEASSYSQALSVISQNPPDVILLDHEHGGDCGIDTIPDLLFAAKNARVLIFTGEWAPEAHYRAFGLGAMGLVFKTDSPDVLIKAIEKVHCGEAWIESVTMARLLREMWQGKIKAGEKLQSKPDRRNIHKLTVREQEVVALIGERLQNKQIADRLFVCEATVRHHLTSIYDKLNIKNRIELALYAYQHGLAKQPFLGGE